MKIRPRDPTHRQSIDITSPLRKLNLREAINLTSSKQDTLIVIANGTPANLIKHKNSLNPVKNQHEPST